MNLIPLNEVYIGKTDRIKLIEILFSYFILIKLYEDERFDKLAKELDYLYEKIYDKKEKIIDILQKKNLNNNFLQKIKDIYSKREQNLNKLLSSNSKKSKYLKKIILCIEKLLEEEFGIAKVSINLRYKNFFNSSIGRTYEDDEGFNGFVSNEFKNEILDLLNNRLLLPKLDIIKVDNSAIKFDVENFPLIIPIDIPTPKVLIKYSITPSEMTSVLLHEIGHLFSIFIIYTRFPKQEYDKLITGRKDENFADQFAAIYGYGKHSVSFESKHLSRLLYSNITNKAYDPHNSHPNTYKRMRSQMERLKAEQHSHTLTDEKRKELNKDLKDTQKALNYHKNHPFIYNNIENKHNEDYANYVNNVKSLHKKALYVGITDNEEKKVEKLARFKAKEITKLMDILYKPGINSNPSIKSLSSNYYKNVNIDDLYSKKELAELEELANNNKK